MRRLGWMLGASVAAMIAAAPEAKADSATYPITPSDGWTKVGSSGQVVTVQVAGGSINLTTSSTLPTGSPIGQGLASGDPAACYTLQSDLYAIALQSKSSVAVTTGLGCGTSGGGGVSSNPPFIANGGTIALSPAVRAGFVVNARDHGAICDGLSHAVSSLYSTLPLAQAAFPNLSDVALTDEIDRSAIQDARNAATGSARIFNAAINGFPDADLVLGGGNCMINRTLDFTLIKSRYFKVDGVGTALVGRLTNPATPVVDAQMSTYIHWANLGIQTNAAFPALAGVLIGRNGPASGTTTAGPQFFDYPSISGYFSLAPYYNFASEDTFVNFGQFSNSKSDAYAYIEDGINHFGVVSQFVGQTAPADTAQSFQSNTCNSCTFRTSGAQTAGVTTAPVWLANTRGHRFIGGYISNNTLPAGATAPLGSGVILYSASNADVNYGLDLDIHMEGGGTQGLLRDILFSGPNAAQTLYGITFRDQGTAAGSLYGLDSGVSSVNLPSATLDIGKVLTGATVADVPAAYTMSGEFKINDTTGTAWNIADANWSGSQDLGGVRRFKGVGAATSFGTGLIQDSVTGVVSASLPPVAAISTVNPIGVVSGIAVGTPIAGYGWNTSGIFVFPKLTIDAPPGGGTQAVAHVGHWGYRGSALIVPGTGYAVGNILVLQGGTCSIQPRVNVATIDGNGGVLTVSPNTVGSCTAAMAMPANVTSLTGSGGTNTGTGAQVSRVGWNPLDVAMDFGGNGYVTAPTVVVAAATLGGAPQQGFTATTSSNFAIGLSGAAATVSINGNAANAANGLAQLGSDALVPLANERPPYGNGFSLATASGSYTVPAGVTRMRAVLVPGGGGGGGCAAATASGAGGQPGTEITIELGVTPGASMSYTIGAAGTGGAAGNNAGTAGGNTTFGGVTAYGGIGGLGSASGIGLAYSVAQQSSRMPYVGAPSSIQSPILIGSTFQVNAASAASGTGGAGIGGIWAQPVAGASGTAGGNSSGYGGGGAGAGCTGTALAGGNGSPGAIAFFQ